MVVEDVDLIKIIAANLSLDIRTDLRGSYHLCLIFGEKVISSVILPEQNI